MSSEHPVEVRAGDRFEFGSNWARFLSSVNDARMLEARRSLQEMLGLDSLEGRSFLDVGSGSGLLSLAAAQLGAQVVSFDYDPRSVACTTELRRRYLPNHQWTVAEGSVLDRDYLQSLGQFDIVYSWGVLHHTGRMYQAFENLPPTVARGGGQLFIAIYNDQGWVSHYWRWVKRAYNKSLVARGVLTLAHLPYLFLLRYLVRVVTGRLSVGRGMSLWYDMVDWLGGYPFEVAKPEQVFEYFRRYGFVLEKLKTCGGRQGCNEFVFRKGSTEFSDEQPEGSAPTS